MINIDVNSWVQKKLRLERNLQIWSEKSDKRSLIRNWAYPSINEIKNWQKRFGCQRRK